jgi:hypothetical protein
MAVTIKSLKVELIPMDFSRSSQPQPAATGAPFGAAANKKVKKDGKLMRWGSGVLLVVVVLLVVAVLVALGFGGPKSEGSYVDSGKLQAVFLNTGQVYFGDIKSLNSKYLVLKNIYYLQTSNNGSTTSTTAANTNVSLVKLGCELHSPYDQMIINREQVTFWENLQDSGQVAKAVKTFEQQNPNGQKCADQSTSNNASTTNNVQGSTNTTTNNSTTTTKP